MKIRLNVLRGKLVAEGKRASLSEIAKATGISRATLTDISKGRTRVFRPEYIDALCTYFGVSGGGLIEAEPVELPIKLYARPDRKGVKIRQKTKQSVG